jgi:hypothetical protein
MTTSRDTGAIVTVVNTDDNPIPVIIAGMATQSDFAAHVSDTTDVHGIVDTSKLALTDAANTFTLAPQQITADDAAHKGLIVKAAASQTANLVELQNSSAAVLSRFNKGGYFVTKLHSAPADGDLAAGELALWFDQTDGAAKLMIKAKSADGTVAVGEVALT